MERIGRKPLEGVINIIRFNWHFYLLSVLLLLILFSFRQYLPVQLLLLLLAGSIVLSLAVSWYIYDASGLYALRWLDFLAIRPGQCMVNIHAGFDETSHLLAARYPEAALQVFDFYDPAKHTEISIARARKVYAAYPGTQTMGTAAIPLEPESVDVIFLFLAAHEIREQEERSVFFTALHRSLKAHGKIIVLEHLRDSRNFLAYNIGFLHFFSREEWKRTFISSRLIIKKEEKITPFLSAFILQKNGIAS